MKSGFTVVGGLCGFGVLGDRRLVAGGGRRQVHLRVDPVLVLAADRDLQLVPRRRQMERARERDERLRDAQRDVALETRRLDLRLLAQPFGLEQRREEEREREDDDSVDRRQIIRSGSR